MKVGLFFTVHNRPVYFRETVESWRSVRGIQDLSEVHFFIEPTDVVGEQYNIAVLLGFNSKLHVNPRKLGVLENPYNGFSTLFNLGYDYVICAEEDIRVTEDILEYHTWAASTFQKDPLVSMVCSYRDEGGGDPRYVFKEHRFSPLIWGTWANRWNHTLGPTWDHDYSSGPADRPHEQGWDWNINTRIMPKHGWASIFPRRSRADHIGQEGGEHMLPQDFTSVPNWSPVQEPVAYQQVPYDCCSTHYCQVGRRLRIFGTVN